jgi:hypothetical protein
MWGNFLKEVSPHPFKNFQRNILWQKGKLFALFPAKATASAWGPTHKLHDIRIALAMPREIRGEYLGASLGHFLGRVKN